MTWSSVGLALLVVLTAGSPSAAAASAEVQVDVTFHGTIDLGVCRSYQWSEGTPSENYLIERSIHDSVDQELSKKGREMVDEEADCFVVSHSVRDPKFPAGLLKVEVGLRESGALAWRGMASGTVPNGKSSTVQKVVRKAVKKMFEQFPPLPRGDTR